MINWQIIGEQKGRHITFDGKLKFTTLKKWVADSGFLTYEEADQERMSLTRRFPRFDFFVKKEELGREPMQLRLP